MGYTHYWYVAPEFDGKRFAKVAADFKTMVTPLRHLGVILADGLGANQPTIAPTKIMFNGLEKCGHEERGLGITWPAKKASGIIKNGVGTKIQETTKSKWFAGAELETRSCGGDCSHETFKLEQKYDNIVERFDGSTYTIDPVDYTGRYFACCKTAYKAIRLGRHCMPSYCKAPSGRRHRGIVRRRDGKLGRGNATLPALPQLRPRLQTGGRRVMAANSDNNKAYGTVGILIWMADKGMRHGGAGT